MKYDVDNNYIGRDLYTNLLSVNDGIKKKMDQVIHAALNYDVEIYIKILYKK